MSDEKINETYEKEKKKDHEEEHETKYWETMETKSDKKSRMLSLFIVHIGMLVFSLGYSIVLTGVLPYMRRLTNLDSEHLLDLFGVMVAINPIGQMIFSPLLGWLTNKLGSIRLVCLVTCVIYIAGNVLYACLCLLPDTNDGSWRWGFMLFGRLLVGISTANQAPIRAYIAGATFKHERNTHISIMSLAQTIGFMIGPAIQSALTPIGCAEDYTPGHLRFDMYTISGWVSAAVGLISLILFMPGIFTEHYVAEQEAAYLSKESTDHGGQDILSVKPDLVAAGSCVFCFFIFLFNFILLETIGTPLCMQQLGWDESTSIQNLGILMTVGAVISLVCYASVAPLTKKLDERLVYLIFGLIPMIAGRLVMLPPFWGEPPKLLPPLGDGYSTNEKYFMGQSPQMSYSFNSDSLLRNNDCSEDGGEGGCDLEWCEYTPALTTFQFYLGYAISAISFPYCMAICQAVFSKVIGPRPQGLWMGLLTAAGSLARILGPIAVSEIYADFGTYWTFGLCAGSLVLSTIATLATYKRLIPIETRVAHMGQSTQL